MITWSHSGPLDGGILYLMAMYIMDDPCWMEVGGDVGLPQTPLALLPFLPGQFDDLYVKVRIIHEFYRWGPPKPALFTSLIYTLLPLIFLLFQLKTLSRMPLLLLCMLLLQLETLNSMLLALL